MALRIAALALFLCAGCGRSMFDAMDAGDTGSGRPDAGDTDAGDTDAGDTDAGDTDAGDTDAGDSGQTSGPLVAFATSTTVEATNLTREMADTLCRGLALDAGLPGTFLAWNGIGGNAAQRLEGSGGWVRTDALPIARTHSDLVAGNHLHPIALDERGVDVRSTGFRVHTFSDARGRAQDSCAGDSELERAYGSTSAVGNLMFRLEQHRCGTLGRLFCFEVGRLAEVPEPSNDGRVLFLSSGVFRSGPEGIAVADALCETEASIAGLPGAFVALLAQGGVAPSERFAASSEPWIRPDGVSVASAADFLANEIIAPINVTASGIFVVGDASVWTGSAGISIPRNGCVNWTSNQTTRANDAGRALSTTTFFRQASPRCSSPLRVYCADSE